MGEGGASGVPRTEGLGTAGLGKLGGALGSADVVLAVGADLFDEVFYATDLPCPDGSALIHVDHSPWEIGENYPVEVGLLAGPKPALQELAEVLVPSMTGAPQQRAEQRRVAMAEQKQQERQRQHKRARERWDSMPNCRVARRMSWK